MEGGKINKNGADKQKAEGWKVGLMARARMWKPSCACFAAFLWCDTSKALSLQPLLTVHAVCSPKQSSLVISACLCHISPLTFSAAETLKCLEVYLRCLAKKLLVRHVSFGGECSSKKRLQPNRYPRAMLHTVYVVHVCVPVLTVSDKFTSVFVFVARATLHPPHETQKWSPVSIGFVYYICFWFYFQYLEPCFECTGLVLKSHRVYAEMMLHEFSAQGSQTP